MECKNMAQHSLKKLPNLARKCVLLCTGDRMLGAETYSEDNLKVRHHYSIIFFEMTLILSRNWTFFQKKVFFPGSNEQQHHRSLSSTQKICYDHEYINEYKWIFFPIVLERNNRIQSGWINPQENMRTNQPIKNSYYWWRQVTFTIVYCQRKTCIRGAQWFLFRSSN